VKIKKLFTPERRYT